MVIKKESSLLLKFYLAIWLVVSGLLLYVVFRDNLSASQVFKQAFSNFSFLLAVHVLFLVIYLLFLVARYFFRTHKKKGVNTMLKQLLIRFIAPIIIVCGSISTIVYYNKSENFNYEWDYSIENTSGLSNNHYSKDGKHRGMTVFGRRSNQEKTNETLVKNNVEWVAVVPFFYQEDETTTIMRVPENLGDKLSRRDSSFVSRINNLHNKNIHVMLKPHLWLGDGWRSNINFETETEWKSWFDTYSKGILHYAKLAGSTNVELFCIGTELKTALEFRQNSWKELIKDIRKVYHGKLTYAANWDGEFEYVDFWDEMDYIGIQGYFPITTNKNPSLEDIKQGWQPHINTLEALSKKNNKPILFTEIGYKNEASATIKPWEWGNYLSILTKQKSNKTQLLAYDGLFETLWDKDWFAGTYIWQWNNSRNEIDFTPQEKPAQNIIAKWYGLVLKTKDSL